MAEVPKSSADRSRAYAAHVNRIRIAARAVLWPIVSACGCARYASRPAWSLNRYSKTDKVT
jgi:hypothetical protein